MKNNKFPFKVYNSTDQIVVKPALLQTFNWNPGMKNQFVYRQIKSGKIIYVFIKFVTTRKISNFMDINRFLCLCRNKMDLNISRAFAEIKLKANEMQTNFLRKSLNLMSENRNRYVVVYYS